MTRSFVFTLCCAIFLTAASGPALAKEKNVGLGFILGEPTGIDVKFWLANNHALEFGAAWSLSDNDEFHLQGDYLFHRFDLIKVETGDAFPLFFGVGGRVIVRDDEWREVRGRTVKVDREDVVGIRFPVGLAYIFRNYPFDIFAEIVPILDIAPDSDFDLEGAIGARFWF